MMGLTSLDAVWCCYFFRNQLTVTALCMCCGSNPHSALTFTVLIYHDGLLQKFLPKGSIHGSAASVHRTGAVSALHAVRINSDWIGRNCNALRWTVSLNCDGVSPQMATALTSKNLRKTNIQVNQFQKGNNNKALNALE
ncbi:hypothetical protein B0H19DRAFT_1073791 [Mycena capillaripes]|nr:hypothetical protein B0H19DRAFT_1073791 [Mycena capillaripes]